MTLSVVYVAQTGHVVGARGVTGEDAATERGPRQDAHAQALRGGNDLPFDAALEQ